MRQCDNWTICATSLKRQFQKQCILTSKLERLASGLWDFLTFWRSWVIATNRRSYDLVDQLTEFISYHAIDQSADLAKELGSYPTFAGSGWSKGILPIDTVDKLSKDRGVKVKIDQKTRLDWDGLRKKVKKGMRNATLMAIAPTANIGHVAGTTPGIDPQFAQIFSRSTLNGKFLEVNHNLVRDLKKLGLWDDLKDEIFAAQGDIQDIDGIPQNIKDVYKTSFQLSPYAFIEVAARAQKVG